MNIDIELKQRGSRVHTKLYIGESMTTDDFRELCVVLEKVLTLAEEWEIAVHDFGSKTKEATNVN